MAVYGFQTFPSEPKQCLECITDAAYDLVQRFQTLLLLLWPIKKEEMSVTCCYRLRLYTSRLTK